MEITKEEIAEILEKCIVPGCENKIYCRGLCQNCYGVARYMIRRKKVTEKQLVKSGKMLPPKTPTTKKSDAYRWFEETGDE